MNKNWLASEARASRLEHVSTQKNNVLARPPYCANAHPKLCPLFG